MVRVPAQAYKEASLGRLSDEELRQLEDFAEALNKEASAGSVLADLGIGTGKALGTGLGFATAGLMAAGLGAAAGKVIDEGSNRLTYRRDLNSILAVHPQIREEYTPEEIHLVYTSMRTLNPIFAKDPLVGGNILSQILRNRDPSNPKAPPRFDIGVAKELHTAQRKPEVGSASAATIQKALEMGISPAATSVNESFKSHAGAASEAAKSRAQEAAEAAKLKASHENKMEGRRYDFMSDADKRRYLGI